MPQFVPCTCPESSLARVQRALWMKLVLPSRFLYQCSKCRGLFLLTLDKVVEVQQAAAQRQRGSGAGKDVATLA